MTYIFQWKQATLRLWAYGMVTLLGLWVIRAQMLGHGPLRWLRSSRRLAETLALGQSDVIWVLGICLIGGLLLMWVNKTRWLRRTVLLPFVALLGISLIMGVVYWRFVAMTGHPVTYPWLVYSDFLQSPDAQSAVATQLSPTLIFALVAMLGLWVGLGYGLSKAFVLWHRHFRTSRWIQIGLIALVLGYGSWSTWYLRYQPHSPAKAVSPIPHFVSTLPAFQQTPAVYERNIPIDIQAEMKRWHTPLDTLSQPDTSIQNILIFVLESTPASLLSLDDSLNALTPNLARYRRQGRLFPNAYSPVPSTNKALFSLLTGMYPWLSFSSITSEYPDLPVEDISQLAWESGRRTAFFTSADNRFQHIDSFLAYRRFDLIKDQQTLGCGEQVFEGSNEAWAYMDGKPDACISPALGEWLDADSSAAFLAVCWTIQTHYPYFHSGAERPLDPEDPFRNRYLNALAESDAAFGAVMDSLARRGLDSSTLVIVLGDHGEAFGQHDQFGHASYVYEENVRIPLLLINPRLFGGNTDDRISSMIDVAPTVAHALGQSPSRTMQGQSLLGPAIRPKSYFVAPFSTFLFGYRESHYKTVLDMGYGTLNRYNLQQDPDELSPEKRSMRHAAVDTLSAWIQYHDGIIQKLQAASN